MTSSRIVAYETSQSATTTRTKLSRTLLKPRRTRVLVLWTVLLEFLVYSSFSFFFSNFVCCLSYVTLLFHFFSPRFDLTYFKVVNLPSFLVLVQRFPLMIICDSNCRIIFVEFIDVISHCTYLTRQKINLERRRHFFCQR